jgi:O-antigen/teichoic acid export membrane protein
MTSIAPVAQPKIGRRHPVSATRTTGWTWLLASELCGSLLGFAVVVRWAHVLGPVGFSHVEYAAAVAAWLLVLVRGGIDIIIYREAARRPRLIRPFTELLLGLRIACAVPAYGVACAVALVVGGERGAVVAIGAMLLIPSALAADVLPRATGRFGWVALAQFVRVSGLAASAFGLVWAPLHVWRAALCAVIAEGAASSVLLARYVSVHGLPRPRWRRRAWLVLLHRGFFASLMRFGRVTLYGADVLALGWLTGAALGPYVAARRLVFALVSLGLVVPTALGPIIARRWVEGADRARTTIDRASRWLWALSLPAAVGLAITSTRWMPALYGPSYRAGGPWLAVVGMRMPWLLSDSLSQAALVACRRDREALWVVGATALLAALVIPLGLLWAGPFGAGLAALIVEVAGASAGWHFLRSNGAVSHWTHGKLAPVGGVIVMAAACRLVWHLPLPAVCAIGALAYGIGFWSCETARPLVPWSGGRAP